MNIIDKYEMLDDWEKNIPEQESEEYKYWAKTYKFLIDRHPLANPVIDSINFRRELFKRGFSFEQIKIIMSAIRTTSINNDKMRANVDLVSLTD